MKVFISGYGRMGKMVESVLKSRNIECSGVSEDITSADRSVAGESVCIDFTVPEAFRANYKFIAENFKAAVVGTTGWYDIADEVFEHTLKRIDELERQVRMLTTGRENIDGNKIWKKFHSEDISINELNEE